MRKNEFKEFERPGGNLALVLRPRGAAALAYAQETMGVSCSTLLHKRRATANFTVDDGAGSLDLTVIMADGSATRKSLPAYDAH